MLLVLVLAAGCQDGEPAVDEISELESTVATIESELAD